MSGQAVELERPPGGPVVVGSKGNTFQDQDVCARCGRDALGEEWPNCVELARAPGNERFDRSELHLASCARYWRGDRCWLCGPCDAEVPAGPEDDSADRHTPSST